MRLLLIACLALVGLTGCGNDKKDNSHIQTPNDQPIGDPKPVGGGGAKMGSLGTPAGKAEGGGTPVQLDKK
jgi:hypothetical protein